MAFSTNDATKIWPEAIIPYIISPSFNPVQLETIKAAIRHWNGRTIARWVEKGSVYDRTPHQNFVHFVMAEGSCSSGVGMLDIGEQPIGCDVGDGFGFGSVVHEMGHAFGYYHEQQRSDRDEFVDIIRANIDLEDSRFETNFGIKEGKLLTRYDYGSIMHYPRTAFTFDPSSGDSVVPLNSNVEIGQRESLSDFDVAGVFRHYDAPHLSVAWKHDANSDGVGGLNWFGLTYWGEICKGSSSTELTGVRDEKEVSVAMDRVQNTIIAWTADPTGGTDDQVYVRCFASVGGGFAPIRISSGGATENRNPAVAVHPDGQFVVAWTERGDAGQRILICSFENNGTPIFGPVEVVGTSLGTPALPSIDMDENGNFVVAWGSLLDEVLSVHARGFNADGTEAFARIEVANGLGDTAVWPRIAMRNDGVFAIIYDDRIEEIKISGFNADGSEHFSERIVNSDTNGAQYLGDVAVLANGDLLIAWTDDRNENHLGQIRARALDFDGVETHKDFTVNTRGGGDQRRPRISVGADERIYIAFEDDVDNNGKYQVHVEIYDAPGEHFRGPNTINTRWFGQQTGGDVGS